jgi:hypothetical protein
MVVDRILLAHVCPGGILDFPLARKLKNMRVRCVMLAATRSAVRFERGLSMESCLVALYIAKGDGVSRIEPQSWPIKVLHWEFLEK